MTLTLTERRRTSDELRRNLALSGLTEQQVADELGYTASRLWSALEVDHADAVDIWQLRDQLEQAAADAGAVPVAYRVLTEESRAAARTWFRLRPAPRRVAAKRADGRVEARS